MTQPAPQFRGRMQFPLWVLLVLPLVCAPLFLLIATSRTSLPAPEEIEEGWIDYPSREFPIKDGAPADRADILGHVAFVRFGHRTIWSLRPEGKLHVRVHTGFDTWNETKPASQGLSGAAPGSPSQATAHVTVGEPKEPRGRGFRG